MSNVLVDLSADFSDIAKEIAAYPEEVEKARQKVMRSLRPIMYSRLKRFVSKEAKDPFGRKVTATRLVQARRIYSDLDDEDNVRGWIGNNPLIRNRAERQRARRDGVDKKPLLEDVDSTAQLVADDVEKAALKLFDEQLRKIVARG